MSPETRLADWYESWVDTYKRDAVRAVTLKKYELALKHLRRIAPDTKLGELDRMEYQRIINTYAVDHERVTVTDFNHLLKASVLDAVDEGLIPRDPTRKVVIKGKEPGNKKPKYLSQFELHALLECLSLTGAPDENWDWMILLIAKTGLRFSEALGLTAKDVNLQGQYVEVSKTWNYKEGGGFTKTKNSSSVRKVPIDWRTVTQISGALADTDPDKPIFVAREGDGWRTVYNSTPNERLARRCEQAGVPVISIHGLRHTHASLLLYAGASMASVSRRLGHSNMTTTQKVYLHVVRELENQDVDVMMRAMSAL